MKDLAALEAFARGGYEWPWWPSAIVGFYEGNVFMEGKVAVEVSWGDARHNLSVLGVLVWLMTASWIGYRQGAGDIYPCLTGRPGTRPC